MGVTEMQQPELILAAIEKCAIGFIASLDGLR
jgi:hypothetical protein